MLEARTPPSELEMAAEIPVWVNNRQRWVTGIGRKTTCDDVIAVLLKSEGHDDVGNQGFSIMERWRRMERPLDGRSRILRVWNAWGDAQSEVRFTLRRVDWDADSGRGSPPGAGGYGGSAAPFATRRRKHHHHHRKPPWPPQTIHPRRLAQLHSHEKLPETIERLMKLILVQGETIQSQLRRLHDRDHQIERLEGETHRARVQALGSNYLLETYLGGGRTDQEAVAEKSNDSGVVTEGGSSDQTPPPPAEIDEHLKLKAKSSGEDDKELVSDDVTEEDTATLEDLRARIELWEKLVRVNKRLEREEETLVRLHVKWRRLRSTQQQEDQAAVLQDLARVSGELEQGAREIEHNALTLAETEALLVARRRYLRRLQEELDASERETERLNLEMHRVTSEHSPETSPPTTSGSVANDTDSNSDTGLSSLHSSSEEGVYVLDTLV